MTRKGDISRECEPSIVDTVARKQSNTAHVMARCCLHPAGKSFSKYGFLPSLEIKSIKPALGFSPLRHHQFSGKTAICMASAKEVELTNEKLPHFVEDEQTLLDNRGDDNDGPGGGGGGSDGRGDGEYHRGRIPTNPILSWYMRHLEEHPVATKAITAALLNLLGDLFAQLVIEKSGGLDLKRISVLTSLGLLLVGPTLHFWYLSLSKVVKMSGPKGAGMRLVLDQFLFSPVFIGVFFIALLTMEGRPSAISQKLRDDWPAAVVANWKIWIPFQFLNFLFVPQQLQVAAANVIALGWNVYLSIATHK